MATPVTLVLRKTPLNALHRRMGAKMVDFDGWDMPVEYSGLIAEHMAVRTGVGLFDVSHMGDIQLRGPESLNAIQHLCMNDASKLEVGQAQYSAMLYPQGTFVDDVIVHKLRDNDYLIVINAGTREKDYNWVKKNARNSTATSATTATTTRSWPFRAQKQPKRCKSSLKSTFRRSSSTTSSGERSAACPTRSSPAPDTPAKTALKSTSRQTRRPASASGKRCSKPARNLASFPAVWARAIRCASNRPYRSTATKSPRPSTSLRPELDRFCKLEKGPFIGSEALQNVLAEGGPTRKLVGLEIVDRGIARDGYGVFNESGVKRSVLWSAARPRPSSKRTLPWRLSPKTIPHSIASESPCRCATAVEVEDGADPVLPRPKKQS